MLVMMPALVTLIVYFAAAVLPAIFLMRYIYRMDRVEKEPIGLLTSLLLWGVVSALLSVPLEYLGEFLLGRFFAEDSVKYTVLLAFLVVGAAEEGMKFWLLKRRTWRDQNFDHRFDGVVYAAFLSLGFAAFENLKYVAGYGLGVAVPRAFLAIPGHLAFSVYMGAFYGRAKYCEAQGDRNGCRRNLWYAYLSAVLLHGFYDACAMMGTVLSMVIFVLFVIVMYLLVIRKVKRESAGDHPLYPSNPWGGWNFYRPRASERSQREGSEMELATFARCLGLTLLIELPAAVLFGLRRRDLLAAVCINTLTNPIVVFLCLLIWQHRPQMNPFYYQLPLEAAVVAVEGFCYKRCTDAETPWLLSLAANCASYGLGLAIQLFERL